SAPLAQLPNVTRRVWDGLRHESLNEPEKFEVMAEIVTWLDGHLPSLTTASESNP
ncbi:MAG: alpha-beta hydrolase superfamily lysophospholipase, partial [Ilumatobacter sp.]